MSKEKTSKNAQNPPLRKGAVIGRASHKLKNNESN
jgi:hypothetical protein